MSAPANIAPTVTLQVATGNLVARGTPAAEGGWIVDLETLLATAEGSSYAAPVGSDYDMVQPVIEHADGSPFEVSLATGDDALSAGDTVTSSTIKVPAGQTYTSGALSRALGRHYITVKRASGTAAPTNEIRVTLVYR